MLEYHKPVLLKEVIEYLDPRPGNVIVDATFGFGGHSKEILGKIGINGKLIAIEQDSDILALSKDKLEDGRITYVSGNFINLDRILKEKGIKQVDGILFDLGISSYHFDEMGKGFSFKDKELDMRLNRSAGPSAADLVNELSSSELADILYQNADEYLSRRIAKVIIEARKKTRINTAEQLSEIISSSVRRRGRIHPATKTFQAIRIEVNNELENLKKVLPQAFEALNEKGRIVIISFHSKEDKIVKEFFKLNAEEGKIDILTKKPVTASYEEIKTNPRARSAKLRAAKYKVN